MDTTTFQDLPTTTTSEATSKPQIADAISFTDEIQPYHFVQLYGGVGSGKNYFIEQLIKGHTDKLLDGSTKKLEPQTVLLITSRRAKVDETLTEDDLPIDGKVGRWDQFHIVYNDDGTPSKPLGKLRVIKDDWGRHNVYQRSVVCTNAFIEKYMQYRYRPYDATTHLWELFDIIVIDEVHSLVLDSTYQSAPFYVRELINEFLDRHKWAKKEPQKYRKPLCNNMILMTGSPDPIENFSIPKGGTLINKFDDCVNVIPKNIHFVTSEDAKKSIATQLEAGEHVLYFTNHVVYPATFCENMSVPLKNVAISFSDSTRRANLEKDHPEIYNTMVRVEESLRTQSLIPPDIQLYITTSRNKEGINIKNEDYQHLYVESHIRSDVVQMAGRIRNGVEHMYVVIDSKDNGQIEPDFEADFCKTKIAGYARHAKDVCGAANEYLEHLCSRHRIKGLYAKKLDAETTAFSEGNETIAAFITYIHEKFPYIRYSYLKNAFLFYEFRVSGMKYQETYRTIFRNAKSDSSLYHTTLQEWFPDSNVIPYTELDDQAMQYFLENGLDDENKRYSEDEIKNHLAALNAIYGTNLSKFTALLSRFCNYECSRCSKDKKKPAYNRFRLRPKKQV